jgi:hypothetical protein
MIDMPTSTLTATDHIRSAIITLESEVIALTELGIKDGSIAASKTHRGGDQHHWCNGSKRVYVSKKDLAKCQEEINRGREVAAIQRRIELLKGLV